MFIIALPLSSLGDDDQLYSSGFDDYPSHACFTLTRRAMPNQSLLPARMS
jgi:hypothetical protein